MLIDRELLRFEVLWAAAGRPHAVFALSPADLERLTGAPLADVTESPVSHRPHPSLPHECYPNNSCSRKQIKRCRLF